jgi:hypothetical protein
MLERGGTKMDGFGQEAQIYAKDGKGLMRFRGEIRAVPFESDAGRRFEEEATKRARLAEAYLMQGEAYFLLPYEKESVEAAERGDKNAEIPAREAMDSAKGRAAKAQPQPRPQAKPQAQAQPQAQPQPQPQAQPQAGAVPSRPTANIPTKGWTPGRLQTWNVRHTVAVTTQTKETVWFVYDLKGSSYSFAGIERPHVVRASDGSPIHGTENLGSTAVSRAVWIRVYKEDRARRSYY